MAISTYNLPGAGTSTKDKALAYAKTDRRYWFMLAKAGEVGWPMAYSDDLYVHDMHLLQENPGDAFVWILREHGTHLYPVVCESKGEVAYCRQVVNCWSGECRIYSHHEPMALYFLVDSRGLHSLTHEEASDLFTVAS